MDEIPWYARGVAAGMAAAGAIGLALNHFMTESHDTANLFILAIGPVGIFLGIGGSIEPRILWSLGKYGQHLPAIYKVIGFTLGLLGVLTTLALVFGVYSFGPRT